LEILNKSLAQTAPEPERIIVSIYKKLREISELGRLAQKAAAQGVERLNQALGGRIRSGFSFTNCGLVLE
jgi:hypothetical protein